MFHLIILSTKYRNWPTVKQLSVTQLSRRQLLLLLLWSHRGEEEHAVLLQGYCPLIITLQADIEAHLVGAVGRCWAVGPPRNPFCERLHISLLGLFVRVIAVSLF